MKQIIKILPNERQSMLFSATQTTKVEDLARISLKKGPLYINVDERKETSTAEGLEQGYVVCNSDARFLLLFTFLRKNLKKKVIVFFSSCNSVKYHAELMNYIDVPVLDLHVSFLNLRLPVVTFTYTIICVNRDDKSNRSEQIHSLNSVTQKRVFCFAQMLLHVVWIFLLWIGSFNSILRMILVTIFIVSVVRRELVVEERVCFSYFLVNLAF
jgi:hypothetical protein